MKGKVAYVVADLEGSTGAWTKAHTLSGTPEWQEARLELTKDVNVAVEALFEMGVKGVVVKDFHRTGYNLIPRYLDRRVKLVSGYYAGPAVGYGKLYGAHFALFVGLHASGGNEFGFLPHTLTSRIAEILVNGERVCEAELFATVLSAFQVPVCFFSGCPAACQEVAQKMEWVVTYPIAKQPEIYENERRRRSYIVQKREGLREKIKKVLNPKAMPLFVMKAPFDCQVIFREEAEARRMNPWAFSQDGKIIRFRTEKFLELYQNLLKIAYFPKLAYQMRSLVLPLSRIVWKIQSLRHLPLEPKQAV
jgi:D-aminopeptidase